MAAGFGDALDQTRLGRRGRLVRGQRLVVPLQDHIGVAADPALELREVLPAEWAFELRIEHQRAPALRVAHLPGGPGPPPRADRRRRLRWGFPGRPGHAPAPPPTAPRPPHATHT